MSRDYHLNISAFFPTVRVDRYGCVCLIDYWGRHLILRSLCDSADLFYSSLIGIFMVRPHTVMLCRRYMPCHFSPS